MAPGRKTGGRDIKPGQILNPYGRPGVPSELRKAKRFAKQELDLILTEMIREPEDRIKQIRDDKNTPALQKAIARLMLNAISRGDEKMIDYFCNRTIGKVKEEIDITTQSKPLIIERRDGSEVVITDETHLFDRTSNEG